MFALVSVVCAVCGVALAIPQCLRIIRSGSTAGVSLMAWQLWGVIGLAWTFHGVMMHSWGMIVPNACSAVFSRVIIGLIMRERGLRRLPVVTVPLLLVAVAVALRVVLGPVPFSLFMLVPQAIAVVGQGLDLVRCEDLFGVSGHYLSAAVVTQSMWLLYGLVGRDIACTISSLMMVVLVSINFVVYVMRRRGTLRAHPHFALRRAA